jgi:hypothetical protein
VRSQNEAISAGGAKLGRPVNVLAGLGEKVRKTGENKQEPAQFAQHTRG